MFACLYRLPRADDAGGQAVLAEIAAQFSPRFQVHHGDLVVVDVSGLERLLGPAATIGEELRRTIGARGIRAHIVIATTQTVAMILAHARPGVTIVTPGSEAEALAPIAIGILAKFQPQTSDFPLQTFASWGLRTLGELAALPAAELIARLGRQALAWQAAARGEDRAPLIPSLEEERFDASLDLEWPIDGLEPLSFVLTRLLEPLSTRLERRDRGAAVLHVMLRLVSIGSGPRIEHTRRLELPSPMRDVRALRTLALLDLEAHPPEAAVDSVRIVIDPTPGRILQHTLFTRPHPTPEQISTLVARLGALMGQDRIGAPATVDTYRPGAFEMMPFATEHKPACDSRLSTDDFRLTTSCLRRCRQPVPARVAVGAEERPIRVTTDRRGFAGGAVLQCAGPWRTSGNWWAATSWDREEWDVALGDGAVYRVFRDCETGGWFIDAIVD